jgi:hypothetical protein
MIVADNSVKCHIDFRVLTTDAVERMPALLESDHGIHLGKYATSLVANVPIDDPRNPSVDSLIQFLK